MLVKYQSIYDKHISPMFGNILPDSITLEAIEDFLYKKIESGLSVSTVKCIKTVLGLILAYSNPENTVSITKITIRATEKEIRVFTVDELEKLIKYLKDNMSYSSLGIYLCLFTGLRIGEVCALQWKNIDLSSKMIKIDATIQRVKNTSSSKKKTKIIITAPKSKHSRREIPLSDKLVNVLELYQCDESCFLLTGENTYIEPRTLQYKFKAVLKKADIADANFHCTRHTFASRCIEAGVDVKTLSELLGHSNINMTIKRYIHPSIEWKRKNIERLSELI